MNHLDELFRTVRDEQASDLHLASGLEPRMRRHGELQAVPAWSAPGNAELRRWMRELVTEEQWARYEETGDLDFAYGLAGVGRFRANYLLQENGAAAVFRRIPDEILPVEALGFPEAVGRLAELERGLVLITGPTGSGKSTTLAAIIDRINSTRPLHIVTIEDPVEFVHREKRCAISQREVGADTRSFGAALKGALRQDADVVLVGEMRDLETIALAVTAAEMGALVFGTLHTNSAAKTIDRMIDVFPADQQAQIRTSLANSLEAIVAQILVPTADGKGRAAACEILLRTSGLANVVRTGNITMLRSILDSGKSLGMRTMDESLLELVRSGRVDAREAYRRATDRQAFETLLERSGRADSLPAA
ncbi:MAG: PilT/PilU family type 4a pilus ATPase [Thermoanaerobaculia bacterium]